MLAAIEAVQRHVDGMGLSEFESDRKTVDAVLYELMILGEAANHVPSDIADRYPEVPWRSIRDFRNFVAHVYFGVRDRRVWSTVQNNLPPLVAPLQRILAENPA